VPPQSSPEAPSEFDQLRAGCERVLRSLPLPTPFSVERLRRQLAAARGRPLIIRAWNEHPPEAPLAIWVPAAQADVISYAAGLTAVHRDHVILHEFGHILFEHRMGVDVEVVRRATPDIDPGIVERVVGPAAFSDRQEHQAELFAALIMHRTRGACAYGLGKNRKNRPCFAALHPLPDLHLPGEASR
jgi:hypothetical protein